jgi:transcriptional regulator with XRE-family HTH domain
MSEVGKTQGRRTPGAKVFGDAAWSGRMRAAREHANLSVDDIAKALSVSSSAVRNWEGGHKFPSRENLEEFAAITAVDVIWLITGFSTDELAIAEKLTGGPAVPFLQPEQVAALARAESGVAQTWPDARVIIPSYPCSAQAFAMEIFDYQSSPDMEAGDIVVIDPAIKPLHGDWVLAAVGELRSPCFAQHMLRGGDAEMARPTMADFLQGRVDDIAAEGKGADFLERRVDDAVKEKAERAFEKLVEVFGEKGAKELAIEVLKTAGFVPLFGWLAPLRGDLIPLCEPDRVIGTMVERRHSRRTFSTRHLLGSRPKA